MKKLTILGLFLINSLLSYSQDGAMVVAAIEHTSAVEVGQSVAVLTQLEQMYEYAEELEEYKEKYEWLKEMKNVQRTIKLLKQLYCNGLQYSSYAKITYSTSSCWGNIERELVSIKLQAAVEMIGAVITQGMSMEPGDRLKLWKEALDMLEAAQKGMHLGTLKMRAETMNKIMKQNEPEQKAYYSTLRRRARK